MVNWEDVIRFVLAFLSSAAFIRLWDTWVFRREEGRKRDALAREQEEKARTSGVNVDLLYAKGFGIQQEWYDTALQKSQQQADKLLERVEEIEKRFEAEKRSHTKEKRELEDQNNDMRRRVHNLEIALVDTLFGIESLTKQMQDAGMEPRWRPMIKMDDLLDSMSASPREAIKAAASRQQGESHGS